MSPKFFLLLLIASNIPLISVAQKQGQERIDSLIQLLPSMAEDSNKVKMLEEISYSYYSIAPDEGVNYGRASLELAQRLGWKNGVAQAYNTIGINYGYGKSDHANALDNYLKALSMFEQSGNRKQAASVLNNIGSLYDEQGEDRKALDYYGQALAVNRELGHKDHMANNLSNISVLYARRREFDKAIPYKLEAIKLKKEVGDRWGVAQNTNQLARIYGEIGRLDTALLLMNEALVIFRELDDRANLGKVFENMRTVYEHLAHEQPSSKAPLLHKALAYADSAIALYLETGNPLHLSEGYRGRSEIEHAMGDDGLALEDQKLAEFYADSVFNLEKDKKLVEQALQYEFDKKEATTRAEQEKKDALSAEELRRNELQRNALLGFAAFGIMFAIVDMRRRRRIKKEHARSEALLLNILPKEVAEELKAKGEAEAKYFDTATILFTDFKGFTQLSEKVSPAELVAELNTCFREFDRLMAKYRIEKIKTIGDAYMAAGGLPDPQHGSAADVVHAALEMQDFMKRHKAEREAQGKPFFEMRVGIHSGPVVAGIVGVKKFQYDIWGDTVNTASRMESSGDVGQVNISEATYELVKNDPGLSFTPRGKVQAKGKGEMEMYFVQ